MTHAPASGERAALRGYRWRYDHIASLVYDALLDGDFRAVRLADPDAGRVDDLVLIKHDRTDGQVVVRRPPRSRKTRPRLPNTGLQ